MTISDDRLMRAIRARDAAIGAFTAAVAGAVEWLAGRPAICRCGRVALWTGDVQGPENSQQLADWYTPSHIVHGFLFGAVATMLLPRLRLGTRLMLAVAVEAAWELVENSPAVIDRYRVATLAAGYSGDSILNSVADIGWMAFGFVLAAWLPVRWSVAAVCVLELVPLAIIRDNLTLNVLMLVHPVDAVRLWQAGA